MTPEPEGGAVSDTEQIRETLRQLSTTRLPAAFRISEIGNAQAALARVEADIAKKNAALDLFRRVVNNQRRLLSEKDAALDRSHKVVELLSRKLEEALARIRSSTSQPD